MKPSQQLRSPLSVARGLGSAKDGTGHWWAQRVSAIAMIPLSIWMIYTLISIMYHGSAPQVQEWLANPLAALPLAALLLLMLYHARLGLQVVIEDYVRSPACKISLLLLNSFFCGGAALVCVLAILKLHVSN